MFQVVFVYVNVRSLVFRVKNRNKRQSTGVPENHSSPARMLRSLEASAPKRARKSGCATKPRDMPLPPDAPPLLQTIDSCKDIVESFVSAERVGMLMRVSKTMCAVLQNARAPARVKVRCSCALARTPVQRLARLGRAVLRNAHAPARVHLPARTH